MAKSVSNLSTRQVSRQMQNQRRRIQSDMAEILRNDFNVRANRENAVKLYESGKYKSRELDMLYSKRERMFAKTEEGTKRRVGYDVSLESVKQDIEGYRAIKHGFEKGVTQDRKNKIFERQINQSTLKSGFSALDKDETKAFYAGTKDIWQGRAAQNKYNEKIMSEFGVSDLETVYKLLTERNLRYEDFGFETEEDFNEWIAEIDERVQLNKRREIIQSELDKIQKVKGTGGTTDDEIYNVSDVPEVETSPENINRIISRIAAALNG